VLVHSFGVIENAFGVRAGISGHVGNCTAISQNQDFEHCQKFNQNPTRQKIVLYSGQSNARPQVHFLSYVRLALLLASKGERLQAGDKYSE
jgi:hypothetical protein